MRTAWAGAWSAVLAASLVLTACAPETPFASGHDPATAPPTTDAAPDPTMPPVREQLTIDFPAYIPLPEGHLMLQQASPVANGTYWNLQISTDTHFEDVVAPLLAAGSLSQISIGDGLGPGLADGTGHAIVFIAGHSVSVKVDRMKFAHEYLASYTVQPGAQSHERVEPWPLAGGDTREWTTAVPSAVPAAFPANLPLPQRPPIRTIYQVTQPVRDGVQGVPAWWLTRDETEVDALLQSWLGAGWELESRHDHQGVNANVRKGPVQVMIRFSYTPYYDAWDLLIVVWDPAA